MTISTIHRCPFILLLLIVAGTITHAQVFPWSVQVQISVPDGTVSFDKIDAPHGDTLHVMAIGIGGDDNVVVRTTDGGTTWDVPLHRVFHEQKMHDLSHPTPNMAVIVGDTMFRDIDTGSTIFYTHDGGNNWQQGWCDSCKLPDGSRFHLWHVSMCDSLNGILSAFLSCLARTTDGGVTWRRIPDPTNGTELFYGMQCLNPSTYLLTTSVFASGIGNIYRTTDSGKTWTHNRIEPTTSYTSFIDSSQGWGVGSQNSTFPITYLISHTTNGGATWDTLFHAGTESTREDRITAISMADATHGIAVGGGGGWLYTNNGSTWQTGTNLDSLFHVFVLTSVTYPHPDKAWATDVLGRILVYQPRTASVPIVSGATIAASIEAYPNPITNNAPVTVLVNLPRSGRPRLSLLDVRGSIITTIDQSITGPGTFRVTWLPPASLPAGMYFLRLAAGSTVATLPVTIMH